MGDKMIGIYKIENLINGKIYIGQSIEIENRWKKHLRANDDFIVHKLLLHHKNLSHYYIMIRPFPQVEVRTKFRFPLFWQLLFIGHLWYTVF